MSEPFQGRERLFVAESQDTFMGLDTVEVEGDDTVEEGAFSAKYEHTAADSTTPV